MRAPPIAAACLLLLLCATRAWAGGYVVELKVSDGKNAQSATSKSTARAEKEAKRAAFGGSVDSQFIVTWKVTRTDAIEAKDVLVHVFVVKLDRSGQSVPPLEPAKVPIEAAITMDFPKDKTASGSQPFRVADAGVYLVRVEAGGDPDKPGQEDFTELEVVIK